MTRDHVGQSQRDRMAADRPAIIDFGDRLGPPGQADVRHQRRADDLSDLRKFIVEGVEGDDVGPRGGI